MQRSDRNDVTLSQTMIGALILYRPAGSIPSSCGFAIRKLKKACSSVVSSATPSPTAPKFLALTASIR
jgi:hypothetical protein